MFTALLQRVTRRCPTHDRPSPAKIRRLEEELGMPPSAHHGDPIDAFLNRDLIDCGLTWCRTRRSNRHP
ncbi:hypothetical protein ACIP9H_34100 [Streptomyces sp. NPDC088732]|uniref:hypothetical protein n=1 Tax=Streptomyces sp. NPDC088732 TaxID=3365879 RepID=UPI0038249D5C